MGVTFDESGVASEEVEKRRAVGEKKEREAQGELARLEKEIKSEVETVASESSTKSVSEFQARGIPEHLRETRSKGTAAAEALGAFIGIEGMKEARESLPKEGPFLVVANHSGGETGPLLALLKDYDAHIAAAEELNFNRSKFRSWLLKKLRMIPIKESLSDLTDDGKRELLGRVPARARGGYEKVVERERDGDVVMNNDFLRSSVALLSRGDVVVTFPEGLFLYDGKRSLRKAYGGVELIAKRYKRLTGKDLPIVPVAIVPGGAEAGGKRRVAVGEPVTLVGEKVGGIDSVMKKLAELMPESLRGYYGADRKSET